MVLRSGLERVDYPLPLPPAQHGAGTHTLPTGHSGVDVYKNRGRGLRGSGEAGAGVGQIAGRDSITGGWVSAADSITGRGRVQVVSRGRGSSVSGAEGQFSNRGTDIRD